MEYVDVDCILKEKGKGKGKKYLCSWMDGAPPQWVAEVDLEGTVALDEWQTATDDVEEVIEDDETVKEKSLQLAKWLKAAKRPCFMVGAGLSASVLPTFRGKGGLWTRNAVAFNPSDGPPPPATTGHKALVVLAKRGHVYHLGSQNYDDILGRAGFPSEKMSELHGNVYMEVCSQCGHSYHRDFYVASDDAKDHETGRTCEQEGCDGVLKDNIVHFSESLPWGALSKCNAKFVGADLTIVLGSSLRVEPAASMPFKSKKRSRAMKPKAVIVNLQATPRDEDADLIIHAKCDQVLETVVRTLYGDNWENMDDEGASDSDMDDKTKKKKNKKKLKRTTAGKRKEAAIPEEKDRDDGNVESENFEEKDKQLKRPKVKAKAK
eukprot:m.22248 g.22248  ORF g.22248 m.22248 type:complete len:378 (+) comp5440_c0_seq1:147-1280(+)